jgi:hypothetical protein
MTIDGDGYPYPMVVVLAIAVLWLLAGCGMYGVLCRQSRRPLSAIDRYCARVDAALRLQYGARPNWFR